MPLGVKALAVAAVLLAVAACGSEPALEASDPPGPARPDGLLGMVWGPRISWGFRGGELSRLDPRSLAPRGPRVPLLRSVSFGWSFSPDGDTLVFGGLASSLRFVDARRVRLLGDIRLGGSGTVVATAWPAPRRVLAAIQQPYGSGALRLAVVDPVTRRVLARRRLARRGEVIDATASSTGLALLLSLPGSVGPAVLVVARPDGAVRSAGIDAIEAGTEVVREASHTGERRWFPGLAVDSAGERAFVVGGGARIAEVDLGTMRVDYRSLAEPVSLLGRLHQWLEPAALAKGENKGPVRSVRWLGGGLLAVSGWDARGTEPPTAAGLKLIDTRTWSVRTLAANAGRFTLAGETLLAHGCCFAGLSAYERDGTRLWHRYGRQGVHDVEALGDRVYVYRYLHGGDRIDVLDLSTGTTLRSTALPRFQLISPQAARWPPR